MGEVHHRAESAPLRGPANALEAAGACGRAVGSRCHDDGMQSESRAARPCCWRWRSRARGRSPPRAPCSCSRWGLGSTPATGCRSPTAAGSALAPKTRFGVRSRRFMRRGGGCGTRSRGEAGGTLTPWPSRRPGSCSPSRRRRGAMTVATSRGYANRRCGCRAGVGGGAGAAPCRSSAWFAPAAWSGSSRTSWSSRSTGCSRLYEVAQADPSRTSSASGGLLDRHERSRERACIAASLPELTDRVPCLPRVPRLLSPAPRCLSN